MQSEADKAIPADNYVSNIPVLAIMVTEDGVDPPESLNGSKEAGLLPQLDEMILDSGHWTDIRDSSRY